MKATKLCGIDSTKVQLALGSRGIEIPHKPKWHWAPIEFQQGKREGWQRGSVRRL